jgi:DNA-binding transcriptional regulator YiaG
MPNIAAVLREEIARVCRREMRKEMNKLRKDVVWLKKNNADLKKRVGDLERENRLVKTQVKRQTDVSIPSREDLQKMRVTGNMVRKLREKLDLTQQQLGMLMGVSGQSVYQMERREGSLRLRDKTRAALQRVRQMGKREAARQVEELMAAK